MIPEKHSKSVNMDIESPITKRFRKAIEEHKNQEQAKIDREIMEIVLKGNNK